MKANDLRKKFIRFFVNKGHAHIPSAPLVPKDDPSTLFISAGMQPLVPYLLGQEHPEGKKLVNWQKCLRTGDIERVGNAFSHTFFEMLGNWSLGDYFKEKSIPWSFEFLTEELGLEKERIYVSVFAGDDEAPRDEESAKIWKGLGIPEERIYYYGKEENWWAAGPTGPCGPDTEIFYDVTGRPHGPGCEPKDNCGRFFEVWNNVFMVYKRKEDGTLEDLPQKNVDTGMGLDRTTTVLQGKSDDYETELLSPLIKTIEKLSGLSYQKEENKKSMRIIADHIRAAAFVLAEGIVPSNKEQGYVLRRLIRRAMRYARNLGMEDQSLTPIAGKVVDEYKEIYPELDGNKGFINDELAQEEERFRKMLARGLREIEKMEELDGKKAFFLYETYGFPLELTEEIARERGQKIDSQIFEEEFRKHQEESRQASAGRFSGGLSEDTPETRKLHTATHLLHTSLRQILGEHVQQKGSNITRERLRFDFSHPTALTEEEKEKVENLINQKVKEVLPVSYKTTTLEKALAEGALAFFGEKYGRSVKVYQIGTGKRGVFSKEVCGGPHVENTSEIGRVKITKEESAGSGVRRVYAQLE